ncbi:MAG TPA: hypothetical protein PK014_14220 [Thermoanaerobaculia bacterium]|nr:hypothetical protein [Thermoanaerobaculia bacterium]HUM31220.1 hypothetical protein [Thermoanaerobaculia bacterium]HXK69544.1 hypothetical protein [Thermoanaerobaculia bacterium]
MNTSYRVAGILLLLCAHAAWSQDSEQTVKRDKHQSPRLIVHLSDQDVLLPITSIEWGEPDRWSISSRYTHMFEKNRDNKTWLNNLSITLSPGIAGGRFAIGYQSIYDPKSNSDFVILSEARAVLLRTWENPLSSEPNRTFVGVEIRSSLSGMINVGVGYYRQITDSSGPDDNFYGVHVGFGI